MSQSVRSGAFIIVTGSALKKTVHASEQERPDVKAAREAWRKAQPSLDPAHLVFIDETGTATDMARTRGRGPKGERVLGRVPYGHWKTTTFIAGLRTTGLIAPFVIDRPTDRDVFLTYVARCLVPELRPGDIVVMDNLPAHKVDGVCRMIEATGARLLYLPAYSPDLNPIEMAFSKLKALLRKAAERSVSTLWDRIGIILDDFNQAECQNFFKHAGYAAA